MITSIIPKVPFIDKQKTITYYQQIGFNVQADYSDYVILASASVELHLFSFPTLEPDKSDFMIYLRVTEIDSLYARFQKDGIAIHPNGKLDEKPWKQKEFSLLDPNGTLLTFGQAIE